MIPEEKAFLINFIFVVYVKKVQQLVDPLISSLTKFLFPFFSRNQEWVFNQHIAARANTIKEQDHANGLLHDMIFKKEGKTSASHLFDVRDVLTVNEISRKPNKLQEERQWQLGRSTYHNENSISSSMSNSNFGKRVNNYIINQSSLRDPFAFKSRQETQNFQSPINQAEVSLISFFSRFHLKHISLVKFQS